MNKSIERIMKDDALTFKRCMANPSEKLDSSMREQLADNYYILKRHAEQASRDCKYFEKHIGDSELISGLFERCKKLSAKGILPDENGIIEFFGQDGLNGNESELLPSVLTCAVVDTASDAVKSKSGSASKQLANSIISLRRMSEIDFGYVAEKLFSAEALLLEDESYRAMDSESKGEYRKRISRLSRLKNKSEKELVEDIKKKSDGHMEKYLFRRSKSQKRGYLFLIMEIIMPLAVSFCLSVFFSNAWVGVLTFLPLWEILRHPIESASLKGILPKRFLRFSVDEEKVLQVHALITVSTLLPSADKISGLEKHLEQLYLSNCIGNIKICCLADFKGAGMPRKPEDRLMLKVAKEAFDRLNKKYDGGFILAVRPRVHSKTQNEFIGKERKRGAITELIRAIKGSDKGFCVLHGDIQHINEVKYLIALDADTGLVFDSARELVAIAEHPMNKPVIKDGRVAEGYGILVPRTENGLKSKKTTFFGMIMAGDAGVTAYDSLTSERYQSLFGEGIFSGKGLICVDAYHKLLDSGLPEEKILSHDIVESGYLRAGFVSDVQITEGFPETVYSYYQRLHRWVRGDWQNIGFIFGKNSMGFISRYKMFDNLRRSFTPVFCLATLVASLFIGKYAGMAVSVCSVLAVSSRNLYPAFNSLLHGGFSALSRLYYSKALPASLNSFVRAFMSVAFLVRECITCADAICKSVWRLTVSHKNLLEWTTSAQSEKIKSFASTITSCVPSILVSAVLLIFGEAVHRLIAIVILFDIPLSLFTSAKINRNHKKIAENQREELVSYAAAMWGFYDDLCGKENNFLPPDNIQFSPVKAVANRTSPTNIGLMLTSFLAARDMGFITSSELYMRLKLSLSSVEKLKKYKGNLLNWYSTLTLQALSPGFVSTVDSGNFLCCLTALKEGLCEYIDECPKLEEIIGRIEAIISETDLTPLYNSQKKLFHIGLDPENGKKSNSYYDLYMSEARMTAYFAVARRVVPKKHWGAMGRIIVGQGRYTGLASWTGTMFEYFMPNLFIPAPSGSLSKESLCFCLHCQKKRAGRLPFGISESGFYAFDGELNYQYKAHGVQKLALKRNMNSETVISPYSTFLTLTEAPEMSLRNLSRLKKMGMTGKYGFYEAVDFTKNRKIGEYSVIRSYMAHHVGMSMLAADNLLNGRCMQKRFMRDSRMKGAESLLEEKIQTGASVFNDIKTENIPDIRERVRSCYVYSDNPSVISPEVTVLSNGRMSVCISDTGNSVSMLDGMDLTVNGNDDLMNPQGIFGVFVTDDSALSFTRAIDKSDSASYEAKFLKDRVIHGAKKDNVLLQMKTSVLKQHNCELRSFTVENTSHKKGLKGKLIVYFEPCIEKRDKYGSHPAFSKLFLTDEWDEENKCMLFSRTTPNKSCALAAGFIKKTHTAHESSREKVLKSPEGIFSLGRVTEFTQSRGNPDCCCVFSTDIELKAGEKISHTLAVTAEESKEQALNTLLSVRAEKSVKKSGENPFYNDAVTNVLAVGILKSAVYPGQYKTNGKTGEKCNFGKEDLWSFGVSGDLPIILIKADNEESIADVIPYIRINKVLRNCGIKTDLVILFEREERYSLPISSAIKNALEKESCMLMLGVRGGIHIAEKESHTFEQLSALEKTSAYCVVAGENSNFGKKRHFKPLKFIDMPTGNKKVKNINNVKAYSFTNGKISIKNNPEILDIPWCMVFANKSFGTLVSDKALGFTWALNSGENKLTPWHNDLVRDNRGEMLILKYNGVLYDLISLSNAEFTPESAVWSVEIHGLKIRSEVSIPKRGMLKKCRVIIENKSENTRNFDLMYFTVPVLAPSHNVNGSYFISKSENGVTVENSFAEIHGFSALQCSEKADYICLSKSDFFEGKFGSDSDLFPADCCVSVGKKTALGGGKKNTIEFYLSWGKTEKSALKMPCVADFGKQISAPVQINTKNKNLNLFFNSFLYSQIKQSRFYGRTGFYQCSGAYGFRDQLQDSLAFIEFEPQLTLTHIARCSAVQFEEGDVLHWWHVITNKKQTVRGVRTRCSDDLLWLPFACMVYRKKTNDSSFLELKTPYLKGEKLSEGENERYFSPERTDYRESILRHCIKAVDFSLNFGKNGFPLVGSCDWNDGFSKIGGSNAESVWLAMFQVIVLEGMAEICSEFNVSDKANEYLKIASDLRNNVENKAWCGDRYARIITEDGKAFYSERDFIDILPQAFAVFADIGKDGRSDIALSTALKKLYDGKTVRLLSPPFDEDDAESVGYIASYPHGIRENGGQYTHAAVWLAMALLERGRNEEAEKIINTINPLNLYDDAAAEAYRAEPFVLAGDISYGDGINGRAGWTHFTGSAGWFYLCVSKYSSKPFAERNQKIVKQTIFTDSDKYCQNSAKGQKSKKKAEKSDDL